MIDAVVKEEQSLYKYIIVFIGEEVYPCRSCHKHAHSVTGANKGWIVSKYKNDAD
ncbi:hypothetical protein BCR41DRAFT_356095 [Lobosporangium transversale]|uniref:Uncharacterized protein n=1 Tax=Lobosporangium transversale TaxID=64571 RepID=A0A1Y2GLB7_9FUNG|nr:hypothetical protein BCR41DRAFT_356095 [Lobosporangium transversale]ORZ12455.1 hypothetical protein BCR41DRAFT_356095 [Lobosporangium transversale]|eukprot:XP_021880074.1 hypothetical protein BCR41DRAFT_356095 [Lobosporangium transversale]